MALMKEITGIMMEKLDNPNREVFSPEKDAMMLALEARALVRHQLANSGRFLEGAFFEVTPATQDFSLEGYPGFVEAERVERLVNTVIPTQYENVEIVDVADIEHEGWIGEYKIAFYGTPIQARVNWDPAIEIWNTLKIWHDAQGVEPQTPDDEDGSPLLILKYMIANRAALMALPKLNKRAPDQYPSSVIVNMAAAFKADYDDLKWEFDSFRFDSGHEGSFQLESYEVGRRARIYPCLRMN